MDVARLGRHLARGRQLDVRRPLFNRLAARRFDRVVTLVGREQSGTETDLRFLDSLRLGNFFRGIALVRDVHDIHPDRQPEVDPKRASKNSLRLVEAGPDRAGNRVVVTSKEGVGKIVSRPGFSRGGKFLEPKLFASCATSSGDERIDKTRMYFVSGLRFDDCLPRAALRRFPNHRAVLFLDPIENVRRGRTPAAIRKNRVTERELSERDFAAAKKRGGGRTGRRFGFPPLSRLEKRAGP